MNTSQFMDKQILGLAAAGAASSPPSGGSGGGGGGQLFDLMGPNPQEDDVVESHDLHARRGASATEEVMVPSYDFQPIRTAAATAVAPAAPAPAAANAWGSLDANAASPKLQSAAMMEPRVLKKVSHEEERSNFNAVTIADIDRTMKKYADNLLHAMEGVSSRLAQLEGRTHHLEDSVGELKLTVGNYNGSTDGKLRQFENTLQEVQAGVQILCDKQEIVEAQVQLAKLQVSKAEDVESENASAGQVDSRQQPTAPQPTVQPQHQAYPPSQPTALPALPAPNAPPPPMVHNQPPPQFQGHLPHPQLQSVAPAPSVPTISQESYYPPSTQTTEAAHQQYQAPPASQQQAPPAAPQHYQHPPQYAPYSQPPPPGSVNPQTAAAPLPHQPEEAAPYGPPAQSYPPNVRPPSPYMPPPSGPVPPFYGPNPGMYEPPAVRPNSGPPPPYNAGYKQQGGGGGFPEQYGYSGSPSHRGNAGMNSPSPFAPTGASSAGSGNYGKLPTAQILPQAAPVSSTPSASSGSRVAVDDVVDKVSTMGFSKEQVRATVRRLTENGQNVDLNVVLDKLMNDTDAQPAQRGWFGR
ncbi:hypothetical protein CFC21_006021 [Triticum aestivum]|uniref:DUF1421 domain-containing protein n=2 Tax=Triticum aestivum TaxID=4565 RepID=A0A3B5YU09_WHEAT|nr:actin cytoskeleton-regulatory complex protein PAN1-like [Triticum aestivum]KAF6988495.1 hypothetical protein CFC21_006021 [Triticum aestivum]